MNLSKKFEDIVEENLGITKYINFGQLKDIDYIAYGDLEFNDDDVIELVFGSEGFDISIGASKQAIANQDTPLDTVDYKELSDDILANYFALID